MKKMQPEQLAGFLRKRTITREDCERMRALGIMLEAQGDEFGAKLQTIAERQLELRQAAHGGRLELRGNRHWDSP